MDRRKIYINKYLCILKCILQKSANIRPMTPDRFTNIRHCCLKNYNKLILLKEKGRGLNPVATLE